MPSLKLCGTGWNISSDDLPIPAALLLVFHLAWCLVIAISTQFIDQGFLSPECSPGIEYTLNLSFLLCVFILACLVEGLIVYEGLKGSLFEDSRRRFMPYIIISHVIVSVTVVLVNVWGTKLIYSEAVPCEPAPRDPGGDGAPGGWKPSGVFAALVWATWAVIFLEGLFVIVPLQLTPGDNAGYGSWQRRWAIIAFCCCRRRQLTTARQGEQQPLQRLSALFYNFFRHADFTSSDVAVTVHLASMLQRLHRRDVIRNLLRAQSGSSSAEGEHCVGGDCDRLTSGNRPVKRLLTCSRIAANLAAQHCASPPATVAALHATYTLPGQPVALCDMEDASHYASFAMAAYGSLYYVYVDPKPTRLFELCCGCLCPPICCQRKQRLDGHHEEAFDSDSSWPLPSRERLLNPADVMNREAICAVAGIQGHDLLYVNTENKFNEQGPYFIALDRSSKSVVVSIRGTLSLDDTMTDLMCHPEDINKWTMDVDNNSQDGEVCPRGEANNPASAAAPPSPSRSTLVEPAYSAGEAGHSGMMRMASSLLNDLKRHQKLVELLGHSNPGTSPPHRTASPALSTQGGPSPAPPTRRGTVLPDTTGWRLVITGHSLGAGIAAFVGIYLRPLYGNVRVWCFSPPGWLLTPRLADQTAPFLTSVVIGKDIVPRLTLKSLEALRDDMVSAGVRCRHSKARVVVSTLCGPCRCCVHSLRRRTKWEQLEDIFAPAQEEATPGARAFLMRYRRSVAEHISDAEFTVLQSFRVPGKVLFIRCLKGATKENRGILPLPSSPSTALPSLPSIPSVFDSHRSTRISSKEFEAVFIRAEDLADEGLLLSKHMLLDHLPDNTVLTIQRSLACMQAQHLSQSPSPGARSCKSVPTYGSGEPLLENDVVPDSARGGVSRLLPTRDEIAAFSARVNSHAMRIRKPSSLGDMSATS